MAQIGGACSNEFGNAYGGKPGNQGKMYKNKGYRDEVAETPWYYPSDKTLVVVARFIKEEYREKIVKAMRNACGNKHIGYSQGNNRNTLREALLRMPGGITISNIKNVVENCETDCSALVSVCVKATCGYDLGSGCYTKSLAVDLPKLTSLFKCIHINKSMKQTGSGTLPGDILVWRNESTGQGHTAVVISTDDSCIIDDEASTFGELGVVITSENIDIERRGIDPNKLVPQYYGQDHNYNLENTKGPVKIAIYDEKADEVRYITKCVFQRTKRKSYIIFGDEQQYLPNVFIGDSRTVQLSKSVLPITNPNYSKQYGLISDECIFAQWGGTLWTSISGQKSTSMSLSAEAAKFGAVNAYFWYGINDVQIYKDLLTEEDPLNPGQYIVSELGCKKFVSQYKNLINIYLNNYDEFDKDINKIYIISIISTSTSEKDYYPLQGDVIDKINQLLYSWTYSEY